MKNYTKTNFISTLAMASLAVMALGIFSPAAIAQEDIIPDSSSDVAQADTQAPDDVENLEAVAGSGQVELSWNVAKDNTGVKGYKIYYGRNSVTNDGGTYEFDPIDVGNKITYTVENLENATAYYFAVTAYDEAGNESENYSVEVSATPTHSAADAESPKVTKAEALDRYTVLLSFSESVLLPTASPQSAFSIVQDGPQRPLDVLAAAMNPQDKTNRTVLLTTAPQKAGMNYILTAGIEVTDATGNPIVSGTSDTAVFTGTDIEPKPFEETTTETTAQADTAPPELIDVTVPDATHVLVAFSEPIILGGDPTAAFFISTESDVKNVLNISAVTLSTDGSIATITTDPQEAVNYNLLVLESVSDMAGNLVSAANNATVFAGVAATPAEETVAEDTPGDLSIADSMAPEDAKNLVAKMLSDLIVQLSWTPSVNSAGDLASYILYKSTDGTSYGEGVILNAAAVTHDLRGLVPGMKYYYKLTAKDAAGNESEGVVTSFMLPETGPGLGLLLLGSAGLGGFLKRRKK